MSAQAVRTAVPGTGTDSGPRGSRLAAANPLSILGAAAAVTVAVLLTVDWVSATVVLAGELALLPLLRISPWTLVKRIWPLLIAAAVGAWGTALLAEKTGEMLLEAGPLLFTTDSVAAGVAIGLRGLAIALPGIFLLVTVDATDLADALAQRLHLPSRFVLGALAAMRLVGLLVQEWRTLGLARHARGADAAASPLGRFRNFLGRGLALLVQAIRRATRLAVAMEARGFGSGERTWARRSTFSRIDLWVLAYGTGLAAAAVWAAAAAGTFNFILT